MSSPPWELIVAPSAERSLARLPEETAAATVKFMLSPLTENPSRVGHRLRGELEGLWAARRGAYRVVYEIDQRARQIHVLRMDHQADLYRRH